MSCCVLGVSDPKKSELPQLPQRFVLGGERGLRLLLSQCLPRGRLGVVNEELVQKLLTTSFFF